MTPPDEDDRSRVFGAFEALPYVAAFWLAVLVLIAGWPHAEPEPEQTAQPAIAAGDRT